MQICKIKILQFLQIPESLAKVQVGRLAVRGRKHALFTFDLPAVPMIVLSMIQAS